MLILTIRTDKPEAELGLFKDSEQLAYITWQAHRQLAETIHNKINELLKSQQQTLADLNGIVVYQGPGSFTGLRIGITVANALGASLKIVILGTKGSDWLQTGLTRLMDEESEAIVLPEYGAEPNITAQKH